MASVIPVDIIVEFRASPKRPTHKDASTRKQESLKAQLQYSVSSLRFIKVDSRLLGGGVRVWGIYSFLCGAQRAC
ncbi:hypothetical protein D9758_018542 [Tetrapyrgos nigripes]|uniref:Uncharacterized protein n=1 Tax=Tetrapyrgos nigripes TaxID=182062 RepID=A0A8H5B0L0_9AGAR|nr:hypothetical protein D9758_018542 [Tetrapyrgos nigripes]